MLTICLDIFLAKNLNIKKTCQEDILSQSLYFKVNKRLRLLDNFKSSKQSYHLKKHKTFL